MAFTLRDYQKRSIDFAAQARCEGYSRLLICLPTGAGKTVVFSELCRLAKGKVLVLAHREELLKQAQQKIIANTDGGLTVGIEQGQMQADPSSNVVVASIRTLREGRLKELVERFQFSLIIYDECHHAAAEDNKRVLTQLGVFDADWSGTLIGFTATTTRGDGIGLGEVFEVIVYERSMLDLIKEGYLVPLRGYRINTDIDLYDIMGNKSFETESVEIESRSELVATSIQELARDRRTIVFCSTVIHAKNLCRALNSLGIASGVVYGDQSAELRAKTLQQFRKEELLCICNVMVLTEGFDDPGVSCIAMARPIKSEGLYAQCIGRGSRLHPGKKDCLVLDFVDLSDLSLVNLPSLIGLPKEFNLQGDDIVEAVEEFQQLSLNFPGMKWDSAELTLSAIKSRAEAFNPLTMELHPEITAITRNGWHSLGQVGLCLHYFNKKGELQRAEVLRKGKKRSQRYHVEVNGNKMAVFSKILNAVEAVDFELSQMGHTESHSARDDAQWRFEPVSTEMQEVLSNLRPPRQAEYLEDALGYLIFAEYHKPPPPKEVHGIGWPKNWTPSQL